MNSLGQVTFTDINCGIATPRPAAAGYIPAQMDGDIDHVGPGTGRVNVEIVEKHNIPSGLTTYEIEFTESTKFHTAKYPYYSVRNVVTNQLLLDSVYVQLTGAESPVFDGMTITVYNDTIIGVDEQKSRFITGSSDYIPRIRLDPRREDVNGYRVNLEQPSDYIITFYDTVHTMTANVFGIRSIPAKIGIYNVTDSAAALFAVMDLDKDGQYSHGDDIFIILPDNDFFYKRYTSWMIRFAPQYEIDTVWVGGVPYADTVWTTIDPPRAGDQYYLATTKPFRNGEKFRFTMQGADSSNTLAKKELDDICVVPNPYVVTASWEPTNLYKFGRGERRLHFYHLPKECTIRIYNLRGHLVDTIKHSSTADDGMEAWDILSKDGNEIAYGIYIYHVEAPGIGEKIGRFALIK